MKENEFKVIGIKKTKADDGSVRTTLYFETPFTAYDLGSEKNTCDGLVTASEYFFSDIDVKLGDIVDVLYRKNTYTGKALAAGVTVLVPAKGVK